jgi:hypothetical protein
MKEPKNQYANKKIEKKKKKKKNLALKCRTKKPTK